MGDAPPHETATPHNSDDDGFVGQALGDHPLTSARLRTLEALEARGIDPFPVGYRRTHLAAEVVAEHPDLPPAHETTDIVTVSGRVMLHRSFGKLVFVTIQDGSGRIQLMANRTGLDEDTFGALADLDVGDIVWALGPVVTTKKGELSVAVTDFALLAKGLRPLPEKWSGLKDVEARSRRRYLDLLTSESAVSVARARSAIVSELRRRFEARGYIEVETPILLTQAGGALARPFVTHHQALDLEMHLRIATELPLKMLVVGGLERVFEIGRIFRNEGIDSNHNPEFTMLESYEAYADYNDIAVMVEEILSGTAETVVGASRFEYRGRMIDMTPPFRRARMVDLVAEAVGRPVWPIEREELVTICNTHSVPVATDDTIGTLVERLFEALVEETLWDPVFVMDHPVEISPLARRHRDDPGLTERFELFVAGAEYANAYSELNDPIDQRRRFEDQARRRAGGDEDAHIVDEAYLEAMEHGMPPMGGLGIGVDRFVMLLTNRAHIREVILFPTLRP